MYKIPLKARNFLSKSSVLSDCCWAASSRVFFSQPGARRSVPFIRSDIMLQKSAKNMMHTFVSLLLFRRCSPNWHFVIIIWSPSPFLFPPPPLLPPCFQDHMIQASRQYKNRHGQSGFQIEKHTQTTETVISKCIL